MDRPIFSGSHSQPRSPSPPIPPGSPPELIRPVPALISVRAALHQQSPIAVTFTVSAIGVSPASLAFTYTVGSNNFPAPQNLTLSSTVATQCTATAATTSGGNWFSLLQNSCVSPGNVTVLT